MPHSSVRHVLLVPDRPGWAFDHRANDMMALKLNNLTFDLKYRNQVTLSDRDQFDIIYAMSLDIAIKIRKEGIPLKKIAAGITSRRIFEKHMTAKQSFNNNFINLIKGLRGVNTASDEFSNVFKDYRPIYKTRIGVDENFFIPPTTSIRKPSFTVGWVGRIDRSNNRELKGYDIVISALENLNIRLETRTLHENYVPRAEMVHFYQGLDCFICSSRSEHIPLPILEAAACGVPIITTNVGIVPQLIKTNVNGIIVERNPKSIREAVLYLMDRPKERKSMGRKVRETILNHWTWKECGKDWEQFFLSI